MNAPFLTRRRMLAAAAAAVAAPSVVAQQSLPPIRLVVPFTPGTGIDLIARQIGPLLTQRTGRATFVDNRPGASGIIGTQEAVRSPADGSTLLVSVNTLVMNRALFPKAGFDPLTDLAPITLTSWGQLLLVASKQIKIDSLQQLIERARAKPGALNYASPGAGTPHHLAMELLKSRAKISLAHITYRGTGPAVTDLLGGQVDLMFLPIHVALQHVRAGSLKALAISSDQPSPLLPQVPSLSVLNVGNLNVDMWYGLLAPKGTPTPLIEKLNQQMTEILALPALAAAFQTQGMTPAHSTPEAFQQLMVADARRWADLIHQQGITAE